MPEHIYSKVEEGKLLHIVNRLTDVTEKRINVSPDEMFLQVGTMKLQENDTFKPHRHIKCDRHTTVTQESWIVIKGRVKATLYDLNDKVIAEPVLEPGDCSITFFGGHTYTALSEDTLVYEYKTGPYMGVEKDKVFI